LSYGSDTIDTAIKANKNTEPANAVVKVIKPSALALEIAEAIEGST
jgi:hypothetical protein